MCGFVYKMWNAFFFKIIPRKSGITGKVNLLRLQKLQMKSEDQRLDYWIFVNVVSSKEQPVHSLMLFTVYSPALK